MKLDGSREALLASLTIADTVRRGRARMRRWLPILVLFVSSIAAAGCGDPDAGKLFADIQYATRCPTSNHCTGPEDRDICGINGGTPCMSVEGTATVSCNVTEAGDNLNINFSASQGAGFQISVRNATVAASGGFATGSSCTVVVVDGVNRYEGRCGPATPSEEQPCQISSVAFFDDMGNPTLEGQIECRDLPNQANPDLLTDVTAVGSGPTAAAQPGVFRLANCTGLEIAGG